MAEYFKAENRWWKWSAYQIDGGWIRPAPGAKLTPYDVWGLYRAKGKRISTRQSPPYGALMRLASRINVPCEEMRPEDKARILDWCKSFGLLGLLTESLIEVWLPATTASEPSLEGGLRGHEHYQRSPRGWEQGFQQGSPPRRIGKPKAILLLDGQPIDAPLDYIAEAHFPTIPQSQRKDFRMPMPLTDEFWALYCERVDSFVLKAKDLGRAMEGIALLNQDQGAAYRGMRRLNRLTQQVRPLLVKERKGRWAQTWVAPSLLSVLSMMAMLDCLKGRRTLRCQRCGLVITTSHPTTRFCGDGCRWVAQKRKRRGQAIDGTRKRGRPRKQEGGRAL